MNLLLLQMTPSMGGAAKANMALLSGLAARGHVCRLLKPAASIDAPKTREESLAELRQQGIEFLQLTEEEAVFRQQGMEVHALLGEADWPSQVQRQVEAFQPSLILVSEEDTGLKLLEVALEALPERVVFISHTPLMLPFGPDCFVPNARKTEWLRQAAGVITPSDYMRRYFMEEAEIPAEALRFPVYGKEPFVHFKNFGQGFVTLVNPCAMKGIPIFLDLAKALPEVKFAAVATWGTSDSDLQDLKSLANVTLLDPVKNIDRIFEKTCVLLAPSLWGEAFGQIALEAMLRGLPVLASHVGGLPEAKLGVDYILPVNKIERYERRFDDRLLPVPVVPPQDAEPWLKALKRVLEDQAHYEKIADLSRRRALEFVRGLSVNPFEQYLLQIAGENSQTTQGSPPRPRSSSLSADKQATISRWLGG